MVKINFTLTSKIKYQSIGYKNHKKSSQSIDNGVPLVKYLVILNDSGQDGTFHGHGGNNVKHLAEHRQTLDG